MAMIRGKVRFDRVIVPKTIVVGEPLWWHCEEHDKYYDRKTGKEVKVTKMNWNEFMELCKLPCCKPTTKAVKNSEEKI